MIGNLKELDQMLSFKTLITEKATEEQKRMLSLADQLLAEADQLLTSVDMLLSKDENGVIDTDTDFNECDDKIILMP